MDGRKGKAVESITEVLSVDWVTRAGAGGHAMNLAEADVSNSVQLEAQNGLNENIVSSNQQGTLPVKITEETPIPLSSDEVTAVLGEYRLPAVVSTRLVGKTFYTVHQVKESIQSEIEYLKQVTGSGSPFGLSESKPKPVSLEEINRRKDAVNKKYLG
jgi:predicted transcriptional regulator